MTSVRIRPRFRVHSEFPISSILENVKEVAAADSSCHCTVSPHHLNIKIPLANRHFWSPELSLSLEEETENKTIIRGLYGPNPTVWGMFTLGYGALAVLGLFSMILGLSQLTLDSNAWGLWILLGVSLLSVLLYIFSQAGQKLGVEQTFTIHHFLEKALKQKIHIV